MASISHRRFDLGIPLALALAISPPAFALATAATPLTELASLRWQHRILVVDGRIPDAAERLRAAQAAIDGRHIVWFVASADGLLSNYPGELAMRSRHTWTSATSVDPMRGSSSSARTLSSSPASKASTCGASSRASMRCRCADGRWRRPGDRGNAGAEMLALKRSAAAWNSPSFAATLVEEVQAPGPHHPTPRPLLQAALTQTSAVAEAPRDTRCSAVPRRRATFMRTSVSSMPASSPAAAVLTTRRRWIPPPNIASCCSISIPRLARHG